MTASTSRATEEARRRALEIVDALMTEAKAGRMPDLAGALARLRGIDPALQAWVAEAMVRSRGDVAAVRTEIEALPAAFGAAPTTEHTKPAPTRPPTVVDGRGRLPWPVVLVAALAAVLSAVAIAVRGQ